MSGNEIPWIDLLEAWAERIGLEVSVEMTATNEAAHTALCAHFPTWLRGQVLRMGHPRPFWNVSQCGKEQWRCVMRFGRKRAVVGRADALDPVLSIMFAYNQARTYFSAPTA